jgi:hypothetical protein
MTDPVWWIDGALVAVITRRSGLSGPLHLGRINLGAMGPKTFSVGAFCGIEGATRPIGLWTEEGQRRRCAKCARRYDDLFVTWVERGCPAMEVYARTWAGP